MHFLHFVLATLIVLTTSGYSSAQGWRNIVPLKSTRADVERLLGPATGDPPRYYLPKDTVYFQYSNCRCGEKCKNDNWNVPPDTVITIRVGMKGVVKLADLNIELTKFKKWPGAEDVPGSFVYKNDDEGLAIEGGGNYVSALIYGPRAKDGHLRCKPSKSQSYKQDCSGVAASYYSSSELSVFKDALKSKLNASPTNRCVFDYDCSATFSVNNIRRTLSLAKGAVAGLWQEQIENGCKGMSPDVNECEMA